MAEWWRRRGAGRSECGGGCQRPRGEEREAELEVGDAPTGGPHLSVTA
jgi:hypothetical protein